MRALLVDRDPDTRMMYAECLRRSSIEIEEAEDGREALAKAWSHHPDVIVTETRLAGINGYELCSLLRSDVVTSEIPILVLTADAFVADINRAKSAGADVVLTKPCLPDDLASEIRRVVANSHDLRDRSHDVQSKIVGQLAHANDLLDRSRASVAKRQILSRSYSRHDTTEPPQSPPDLRCPTCDRTLTYLRSYMGGVSVKHQEQWDYFECPGGCGTFQFRQRTRSVRRIV
jgi:CheY-like chemotaxis protein